MKNMKKLFLLSLLFSTMLHAQQIIRTPGWHRVGNTAPCGGGSQGNATFMDPTNFPANLGPYTSYGFDFPGQCRSFINDSNGGVIDTTRHRLIIYGGGHSNYWGNDLVSFEMTQIGVATIPMFHLDHSSSPIPSTVCPGTATGIVTEPSGAVCNFRGGPTIAAGDVFGLPHCAYTTGCFPTRNTPGSGHTYQGIVYIPPIFSGTMHGDEMLFLQSTTSPNGNGSNNAWVLDMSSVPYTCAVGASNLQGCDPNWIPLGSGPAGDNFYLNPNNVGIVAAYDPNTQGVWIQDPSHLQFYDPVARTVVTKSNNGLVSYHATGAIDPIDNYFIFVGNSTAVQYELLTSPYTIVSPTLTGCSGYTSGSNIQYSGVAWDPVDRRVVIWPNQGNVLYILDPKTWTCTTETYGSSQGVDYPNPTDTSLGGTQGTFGHFGYEPSFDAFPMCNTYNDDCWYLRRRRGNEKLVH